MQELNSFSKVLKNISDKYNIKENKIVMEVIGNRIDMYQNILPLLFNIEIINKGLNEYNEKVNKDIKIDCILIDGPGVEMNKSNIYIYYDKNKHEYFYLDKKEIKDDTNVRNEDKEINFVKLFQEKGYTYY